MGGALPLKFDPEEEGREKGKKGVVVRGYPGMRPPKSKKGGSSTGSGKGDSRGNTGSLTISETSSHAKHPGGEKSVEKVPEVSSKITSKNDKAEGKGPLVSAETVEIPEDRPSKRSKTDLRSLGVAEDPDLEQAVTQVVRSTLRHLAQEKSKLIQSTAGMAERQKRELEKLESERKRVEEDRKKLINAENENKTLRGKVSRWIIDIITVLVFSRNL